MISSRLAAYVSAQNLLLPAEYTLPAWSCFSAFQLLVWWPRAEISHSCKLQLFTDFKEWIFLTKELIRCKTACRRMWLKMQGVPPESLNQAVRFINAAASSKPCSVLASPEMEWGGCAEAQSGLWPVPGLAQGARARFATTSLANSLTPVHSILLFPG